MIPFSFLRKIFPTLTSLVFFYLLRKFFGEQIPKRKSHSSDFDTSKIVEGEIVEEET